MAKYFYLLVSFIMPFIVAAQSVSTKLPPNPKNEFGINITGLFSQFLKDHPTAEYPVFAIYRRHFDKSCLRFSLGGQSENEYSERTSIDSLVSNRQSWQLETSIGLEKNSPINNKWAGFFGTDFNTRFQINQSDDSWRQDGYQYSSKYNTFRWGIAPFVGIRFNINQRLILMVEARMVFGIRYYTQETKALRQFEPTGVEPYFNLEKKRTFFSKFQSPDFLIFAVRL